MVKPAKITILLALCLTLQAKYSYASICPSHTPQTSLHYNIRTVEYVRDISSKELKSQHFLGDNAGSILGLAGGEVGLKFEMKFEATHVQDKFYCLRVKQIDAQFYAKPKIYIASNFSRGSCEYNKTLRHEGEHVTILRRAHKEYTPKYRNHLRKISKDIPVLEPVKLIDVNTQKDALLRYIDTNLSEYLNQITQDVALRQKKIDTTEEYERVYSKCKRWEKKLDDGEK